MGPPLKAAENFSFGPWFSRPLLASMGPPLKAAENARVPRRGRGRRRRLQWGRR